MEGEAEKVRKKSRRYKNIFYKGLAGILMIGAGFVSQAEFVHLFAESIHGAAVDAASYTWRDSKITGRMDRRPDQEQAEAGTDEAGIVVVTVDKGIIAVTVNNVNEAVRSVKVNAVDVANAVLTEEEMERASRGDVIEIRIDVKRVKNIPEKDMKAIVEGMETYQDKILGLTMGMYVDISIFKRIRGEEWRAVHETEEPVEMVLDIPEEFLALATDFYIIRAHEGENMLLKDKDDDPGSITIESGYFSTCAVTYKMKKEGTDAEWCGLCHICPTFLGICCFIWLAALAAALVALVILMRRMEREEAEEEEEEEAEEEANIQNIHL